MAEPQIGTSSTATFSLDQGAVDNYYGGLELDRGDRPVPSMLANNADRSTDFYYSNGFGNLWMRQEFDFHQPLQIDAEYQTSGEVVDIYTKRDRTVVLATTTVSDGDGEPVVTQRHHQSFLLGQDSGSVELRSADKKEGARTFAVPEGDELEPLERAISLEMCGQFFHGARNYHTDLAASEELGFTDVVVGGKMTMSMVGEVLDSGLGDPWRNGGSVVVKFTNIVWPGETVRARAVVNGSEIFSWIEKEDGTIAVVADASIG